MTQKLKKILLLSFIGIIIASCELQEEAIHQHEHDLNLKLYEMKLEELMTNKKFVNSFSKLPKSKKGITNATFGRTVMENEYGFTIADKPAKVIENNGETSYTFLITRDSTNADSFENLVIQTDSTNTTKAIIIKYNLTSPITSSADDSYSFTYNKEITPIVYNNTTVSETSKMVIDCHWISVLVCNNDGSGGIGPEHIAGPNCTKTYHSWSQECFTFDDGMSDGGGGTSSYGGGSGGTGGIKTSPVNCDGNCITEAGTNDDCDKLKNLFLNKQLKVKEKIINDLRPNIAINPDGERSAVLQRLPDGTMGTTVLNPTNTNQSPIKSGSNYFSGIHTHPLSTFPMFSWSDVLVLHNLNNGLSSSNTGMASFLLVCQDQNGVFQTYAIVFNNEGVNTLDIVFGLSMNAGMTPAKIAEKMDENLGKKYAIEEKNGTFDYAKAFLSQFSGGNVSLYKANSNLDSWSRLHINTATNNSMEIPCED